MIIAEIKKEVEQSQEFKSKKFQLSEVGIKNIFRALRTNLYKQPIESLIREYVCNAIDSCIEAGKPVDVEVRWIDENKLLGQSNELRIVDKGMGISPERFETIFTQKGESSKNHSNELVGGFGIGSLSGFAYSDSIMINTVYEGVNYKYLCFVNQNDENDSSLISETPTNEENGTEVVIPIKSYRDKEQFQKAIDSQLFYFDGIKYYNLSTPTKEVVCENEDFLLCKNASISDCHLILGKVAYSIDWNTLGISNYNEPYKYTHVCLKFKIGELQPTLSREEIYYTEKTKALIKERIAKVRKQLKSLISKELNEETNYIKWCSNIRNSETKNYTSNDFNFAGVNSHTNNKLKFKIDVNGEKLEIPYTGLVSEWFGNHEIKKVTKYNSSYKRRRNRYSNTPKVTKHPDYQVDTISYSDTELPMYYCIGSLNAKKNLFLFESHPEGFLIVKSPILQQSVVKEELKGDTLDSYNRYLLFSEIAKNLPRYEDVAIPETKVIITKSEEFSEQYKEIAKQRKLEGKFTCKEVGHNYGWGFDSWSFRKGYEYKFEDVKEDVIIYCFNEESDKMLRFASILGSSSNFDCPAFKNFKLLKISRNYEKQFKQLNKAYYLMEVLEGKTGFNNYLADIASANNFKNKIEKYSIASHFKGINNKIAKNYASVNKFTEENYSYSKWHDSEMLKNVVELCNNIGNLNKVKEEEFKSITDYFMGAELLTFVECTDEAKPYIIDFLNIKGKELNQ